MNQVDNKNTQTIQRAFAAFGAGDLPGILELLSEQVDWQGVVGAGPELPWAGLRRGKAQVAEFFQAEMQSVEYRKFEPRQFLEQGDTVVVLGYAEALAKPSGRPWQSDWVMVFTVKDGLVTRFREYIDVLAVAAAY